MKRQNPTIIPTMLLALAHCMSEEAVRLWNLAFVAAGTSRPEMENYLIGRQEDSVTIQLITIAAGTGHPFSIMRSTPESDSEGIEVLYCSQ